MDESLNFSSLFARGALGSVTLGLEKPLRLQTCLETQSRSPKRPPDAGRVMLASLVLLQTSSQGDKGTCAWSRTQSPHSGGWEGSLKAAPPPRAALPRCV